MSYRSEEYHKCTKETGNWFLRRGNVKAQKSPLSSGQELLRLGNVDQTMIPSQRWADGVCEDETCVAIIVVSVKMFQFLERLIFSVDLHPIF